MKTILVLTDFSDNALTAAESAVILAGKIRANLLIVHSDNSIPLIPYYEGVPVVTENTSWEVVQKQRLSKLVTHLRYFADLNLAQHLRPKIHEQFVIGELWSSVQQILKRRIIEMIVLGGRSGSKVDHILFGSDTSALIEHVDRPVLIIPPSYSSTRLDRVIFATNFNETDIYAVNYLFKLGKQLQYQLEIVHITLYGDNPGLKNERVRGYINELSEKKYPAVMFRDIKGKRLLPRLIKQCQERETDILALSHQHHSYFMRMLKEGTVMMSVAQQKIPIMIFPAVDLPLKKKKGSKTSLDYVL
ncbi:universal stress protein [Pedobacter panaciterrae]